MIERMPYIAWNLLRLWKSLTRHFSESIFPSRSIRLIKSIRSIHFLTRPKQHRKRGTLGSPLGPFCKAIRAEWQPTFGWKSLFWGVGGWWIKKRGAPKCSSCQCKDIQKNGQMQIGNKKHWQPPTLSPTEQIFRYLLKCESSPCGLNAIAFLAYESPTPSDRPFMV